MAFKKKDETQSDKKNWYTDRYQRVVVERNVLMFITMLALVCATAATFSISQLAPLKSVEPFIIQVDQKSGMTQVVDPLKASNLTANEAVNDYFIVQYIRARESYVGSYNGNYYNYNLVRVFSLPRIFEEYRAQMSVNNPDSFAVKLGPNGSREVHIASINFLDKHISEGEEVKRYLVKLQITESGVLTGTKSSQKIALIEFKYTPLDLSTEDRYLNPIGFRVLSYRVDEDNITQ